jgi:hypothetical protein
MYHLLQCLIPFAFDHVLPGSFLPLGGILAMAVTVYKVEELVQIF